MKSDYHRISTAVVIPFLHAFGLGVLVGEFVGSLLLSANIYYDLGIDISAIASAALVGASAGALVGWVLGVRWWIRAERQEYYDNYDLRIGSARIRDTVEIVHRLPNGRQQIDKAPFSRAQLRLASQQLINLDWSFSLRPFYHIFGQSGAVDFRTWMIEKQYAMMSEGGKVNITELGRYTFSEAAGEALHPAPTREGYTAIYPSRSQIHTQHTAYEHEL
jgi:hypothetical protein